MVGPLNPNVSSVPTGALAVVTGGGTAGHVLPAIAVADGLVAAGAEPGQVLYVGCQRGIERRLIAETEYRGEYLDVVGLQRSLSRRNLAFVPKMARATRDAASLLRAFAPKVVVTVGGYASMPSVFAARRLGIPVIVISYDRRPGRASRLAARFAAASAVAFDDSDLPRSRLTGAPVRPEILAVERGDEGVVDRGVARARARAALGIESQRFLIAVMGGSQGSGVLNKAVGDYLQANHADKGLAIRHIAGERFVESLARPANGRDGAQYQPLGYESQMADVYAAADLLIGRGGAGTVHEVAVTGIPAVLVPWSGAAEDHQSDNVRWLSDDGAAIFLPEPMISELATTIDRLRTSSDERIALAEAARRKGERTRSGALADLILEVATSTNPYD